MFIEASEVPLPSLGNEEQDFNGFNTVIDEIEAIMSLIENNKKASQGLEDCEKGLQYHIQHKEN